MSVVPKLSKKQIREAMVDIPKRLEEMKKDDEDRRCLRGKYTPPGFKCMVCKNVVKAVIQFPHSDRIGASRRARSFTTTSVVTAGSCTAEFQREGERR